MPIKPKTVQQQINEGDPRKIGIRKLREKAARQVQGTKGLPDCPGGLRGRARAAWAFYSEELANLKQDWRADGRTLAALCIADEAMWVAYQEGDKVALDKALKTVRSLATEFGLSPVSRTRLELEKPNTGDSEVMKRLSAPREKKAPAVN